MVFTVILSFFAISLQAQTSTKTLKLFAPPNGNGATDSILLWRSSDSTVYKGAPVSSGGGGAITGDYWSLTGNSGTVASTNFIGTTDSVDWLIKTNNTERMRITADGKVGINTATPQTTLDVTGNPNNPSSPDGIKAPLITLAQLNAKTGYGTNQTSALVYVTDVTGGSTVPATANVLVAGYYYWDGTTWQLIPKPAGSVMFSASLGDPQNTKDTAVLIGGAFTTVPLNTVQLTLGGGTWTPATSIYTIPVTGTYILKALARVVDSAVVIGGTNVFMAIGDVNQDQNYGIWQQYPAPGPGHTKWTMLYTRITYLTAGTQIRLFIYADGGGGRQAIPITYSSMDIVFLSQIGAASGN